MSFQDNLKKYRLAAGYQQAKDFALSIGLKYSTYAGYESQGKEPKYDLLCQIAQSLGTSPNELLGFDSHDVYKRKYEKLKTKLNLIVQILMEG